MLFQMKRNILMGLDDMRLHSVILGIHWLVCSNVKVHACGETQGS